MRPSSSPISLSNGSTEFEAHAGRKSDCGHGRYERLGALGDRFGQPVDADDPAGLQARVCGGEERVRPLGRFEHVYRLAIARRLDDNLCAAAFAREPEYGGRRQPDLGDEERRDLTDAGVRIDAAIERLKIVQTWLPFDQVEAIARLPLVVRITPPSYATPR